MAEKNVQVEVTKTGTTTLATAGKYCDRNIDINTDKVYAAGKQAQNDAFWNSGQSNGKATYLPYFFAGGLWNATTFKPKYDIKPKGLCTGLFRQSNLSDLKGILENQNVILDTSQATNLNDFGSYNKFTRVPKVDLTNVGNKTSQLFANNAGSSRLVHIDELVVSATTQFTASTSFINCDKLEHVIFSGVLGTNGLDLHWSTLLDQESLRSIINILQDKTSVGGTWTVTLGAENLAKLTDAEKAIATQKGWTLA